jgi:hypothetical protein
MRPIILTAPASTGASQPAVVDYLQAPVTIGLMIEFPNSASATCAVQYTYDDPFATYATNWATNANWQTHPILTGITSNSDGYIATPVRGIRLNNTAWASGNPTLTIVQGGVQSG